MRSSWPARPFPRCSSPVRPDLSVHAPSLLSGVLALCAAKVRTGPEQPLVGGVLTTGARSGGWTGLGKQWEKVPGVGVAQVGGALMKGLTGAGGWGGAASWGRGCYP